MNCHSVKIARGFFLLLVVTVGIGMPSFAATPPSVPSEVASQTVKGEVVMIAGDLQVVKDAAGQKVVHVIMDELTVLQDVGDEATSFDVNEATQVEGTVTVGDTVEVLVSGDGRALSIRKTQ